MPFFERLHYALYLAIALTMLATFVIALGTADAIAILPWSVFEFSMSPWLFLLAYATSFVAAPYIADRYPIKRDWQ